MTSPAPAAVAPAGGSFAAARAVADAVLYEGYLLYPYRRSALKNLKNKVRWQFGVLTPKSWIDRNQVPDPGVAGAAESWYQRTDCLLEAPPEATVSIRVRFLQLVRKQVYQGGSPVDRLDVAGQTYLSFDEATPREVDAQLRLGDVLAAPWETAVSVPASSQDEFIGTDAAVRRRSDELTARLCVSVERADAPFRLTALTVRLEHTGSCDGDLAREDVLSRSLLATHLLLEVDRGRFLSLLDPPEWAAAAVGRCRNEHVFPVLAGADPRRDRAEAVLCSPILLYDHPQVAPESPGDLHDAAEIDEILSLRTMTLTDAEKREARATDPRAAAIVDRVEQLPPELLARLHGAVRDLEPVPDTALVGSVKVGPGSRVRLRPRRRGTDAQDMFLAGRTAQVQQVLHDLDGRVLVAVIVEDDPAADLLEWYGRYFQFPPEELEAIP